MKKSFKRCLSAFLVVVMLCSVFSISVSAATYTITLAGGYRGNGANRVYGVLNEKIMSINGDTYIDESGIVYTIDKDNATITFTTDASGKFTYPEYFFDMPGYTQTSWVTSKTSNSGKRYAGASATVKKNTTYYAGYNVSTFDVTFMPGTEGEGEPVSISKKSYNSKITLEDAIFTRPGYLQIGWATTENSDVVEYELNSNFTITDNVEFYPVWVKPVYDFNVEYDTVNFGAVCEGYSDVESTEFTVINNSNVPVSYVVPQSEYYNIEFLSQSAQVGESVNVSISPKPYLEIGVYQESISIGVDDKSESSATVDVSFIVRNHIYTEWEETLPATSDSKGVKARHCQYCGRIEYIPIPQLICEAPVAVYASVDEGSITLSWNTSFGADSYNIYKLNDSGEWDYLASTLSGNELMHTDTGNYENNSVYTYAVTAVNEVGETAITDATIDVNYIIHDFCEWETRKPASCVEDGEEYRVCNTCGAEETKVIPSFGGHSFPEEWETVVELNCTTDGEYARVCAECGETENKTVVASGHKFESKWTVDKTETCTEDGKKSRHCLNCNEVTDETVIEAIGHDFSLVATLDTHPHGKIYCCNNCGEEKTEPAFDPECNECMFVVAQLPNGTLQVNSYIGSDSEVSVPARIGGKVVSSISSDCFRGNKNIVYVEIPDTVTKIPDNAFQNCTYLQFVDTAGSLTSIGDYAFSGCVSLVAVNLYPAVTSIGNGTFDGFRGYILCVRNSFAHQYAVENNLLYDLKDILAKDGSRIDYDEKVIFTNNFACDSIEDIIECFGDVEVIATSRNPAQKYLYGTGSAVSVFAGDEYLGDYVVIVEGDVNGDSVCDVLDMYETMKLSNGKKVPTQEQIYAANGEISDDIDVNSYQNVVNKALS